MLSARTRFLLAGLLLTALVAYAAVALLAYLHVTRPSSLLPDLGELQIVLFDTKKPVSRIQRLLESTTGEMNRGGTMRPAFTDQSLNWESLTQQMTDAKKATLLAEREAERLALLDWVASGADRLAYDKDDYEIHDAALDSTLPLAYRVDESQPARIHVRIRTIIEDRCVTCHGEGGRHDTARFIDLDTPDRLAPHVRPEASDAAARSWIVAALAMLYPLAAITGSIFCFTSQSVTAKRIVLAATIIALSVIIFCWLAGEPNAFFLSALLMSAAAAIVVLLVQMVASVQELLIISPQVRQ